MEIEVILLHKDFSNISFVYSPCDLSYIDEVIKKFNEKANEIINFFHLENFTKPILIKFWDTIDDFEKNMPCSGDHVIGGTMCTKEKYLIYVLTYQEMVKRKGHAHKQIEDIPKLLLHEFVHVCHMEKLGHTPNVMWLREGLAVTLSNQYEGRKPKLDCSVEDIIQGKTFYDHYHTICDYILKAYGEEYLYTLALHEDIAHAQTKQLFEEAYNWVLEKQNQSSLTK